MGRDSFLHGLWDHLVGRMPPKKVDEIMRHYAAQFDDAGPGREAEIAEGLGDPAALANRLVNDWAAAEIDFSGAAPRGKSGFSVGLLMLGIFVGLPLAVAGAAMAIGLLAGTAACIAAGAACVLGGFSVLFSSGLATAIFYMGGGFLSVGVGLLLAAGALGACKGMCALLVYCVRGGGRR